MAKAEDSPNGGMVEDITFLKARCEELQASNDELSARLDKLEKAPATDSAEIVDAVNAMHLQVFGVPAGQLQTLKD